MEDLPNDAPVRALGKLGRIYYFLDSLGQLQSLKASEIGRLEIVGLFGGEHYLVEHFPAFNHNGDPNGEWKHGRVGPLLIRACTNRGLWNPLDRVRGAGCWTEDDGTLVMHCGDVLYVLPPGQKVTQTATGLRGALLYPHGEALPRPDLRAKAGLDGPGAKLLDQLSTWNWTRGDLDARLLAGWIGCALLGAAQPWRPAMWMRGGKGSGKSTAQKLVRWIMGAGAILKAENATPAGISQTVGYSTLPVSLDELEAKANNQRTEQTIELMRIAASGGEILRGGADGSPTKTQLRNCFLASSVLMPPLKPQDRSRMAILALARLPDHGAAEDDFADDDDSDADQVLGKREAWERVGREIRGRMISQWPRYTQTLRAFRRALITAGHDARGADQFAALGAALDCITHDGFSGARAAEWGAALPVTALAETADQLSEERECLNHLLAAMPDHFRGGSKESVSWWLYAAKGELLAGDRSDEGIKAQRTLARLGLRLYRDRASVDLDQAKVRAGEKGDGPTFWLAVSNTHEELARIFHGTHWKGEAGASGTWAQALGGLPYAVQRIGPPGAEHALRVRIDRVRHYATAIPWETIFPADDSDEAVIAPADRIVGE